MANYGDTTQHVNDCMAVGKNPPRTTYDNEKPLDRTGESNKHRSDPAQVQPDAKAYEWMIVMGHDSDNFVRKNDYVSESIDFFVDAGAVISTVNKDFYLKWKGNRNFEEDMEIVITVPLGITLSWWDSVGLAWVPMVGSYVYPPAGTLKVTENGELLLRANVAAPGTVTVGLLARKKTANTRWGEDSLVITATVAP